MTNRVDPDETARYELSHLDLHCLHRFLVWSTWLNSLTSILSSCLFRVPLQDNLQTCLVGLDLYCFPNVMCLSSLYAFLLLFFLRHASRSLLRFLFCLDLFFLISVYSLASSRSPLFLFRSRHCSQR